MSRTNAVFSGDCVHVPPWVDKNWVDSGPYRKNSNWPTQNHFLDITRPALRSSDLQKLPTGFAKRFGIFPGRTDGRSRTSPTRADSRKISVNGRNVSTETLVADLTASAGQPLDDLMADHVPQVDANGRERDGRMTALKELLFDEFWQSICFGDLTMNELLDGKYLSMDEHKSHLSGDLHPLLERKRWQPTDKWHDGLPGPKTVHENVFHRTNFDVGMGKGKDGRLWELLQPALQIATRLIRLLEKPTDPVLRALLDITHRCHIPPEEPEDSSVEGSPYVPKNKPGTRPRQLPMRIRVNPGPEERLRCLSQGGLRFDPIAMSFEVLNKGLRLRIADTNYASSGRLFKPGSLFGCTNIGEKDEINMTLSAHMIWPLLYYSAYSEAERSTMSLFIALVLLHEFMHGIEKATQIWLFKPHKYGLTAQEDIDACKALRSEIWPGMTEEPDKVLRATSEPAFENDSRAELGHAWEQHILGGLMWPLCGTGHRPKRTLFESYAGITLRKRHLRGISKRADEETYFAREYSAFLENKFLMRFFDQAFWSTALPRYGFAALREASETPAKVFSDQLVPVHTEEFLRRSNIGTMNDRQGLDKYMKELTARGRMSLVTYMKALLFEAEQFQHLIETWMESMFSWAQDDRCRRVSDEIILACDKMTSLCQGKTKPSEAESFEGGFHIQKNELISKMMDLSGLLELEQQVQEVMLTNLYILPRPYWQHYQHALPGHKPMWTLHANSLIDAVLRVLDAIEPLEDHLSTAFNEWRTKLLRFKRAFQNIQGMLDLDRNKDRVNWRDELPTVSMARKSRRTYRERWEFIARHDLLALAPAEAAEFEFWYKTLQDWLNVVDFNALFPGEAWQEPKTAHHWLGLVDAALKGEENNLRMQQQPPVDGRFVNRYLDARAAKAKEFESQGVARAALVARDFEQNRIASSTDSVERTKFERLALFGPEAPAERLSSGTSAVVNIPTDDVVESAGDDMDLGLDSLQVNDSPRSNFADFTPRISIPRVQNHPTPLAASQGSASARQEQQPGSQFAWPPWIAQVPPQEYRRRLSSKPLGSSRALAKQVLEAPAREPGVQVRGRVPVERPMIHEDALRDLGDGTARLVMSPEERQRQKRTNAEKAAARVRKGVERMRQIQRAAVRELVHSRTQALYNARRESAGEGGDEQWEIDQQLEREASEAEDQRRRTAMAKLRGQPKAGDGVLVNEDGDVRPLEVAELLTSGYFREWSDAEDAPPSEAQKRAARDVRYVQTRGRKRTRAEEDKGRERRKKVRFVV